MCSIHESPIHIQCTRMSIADSMHVVHTVSYSLGRVRGTEFWLCVICSATQSQQRYAHRWVFILRSRCYCNVIMTPDKTRSRFAATATDDDHDKVAVCINACTKDKKIVWIYISRCHREIVIIIEQCFAFIHNNVTESVLKWNGNWQANPQFS